MNSSDQTLRPLGLGEVLDRAVTLCVKHFVALATIFVVYAIPYAIVQYFATKDLSEAMGSLSSVLTTQAAGGHRADPNAIAKTLSAANGLNGWFVPFLALAFFVGPLPAAALIVACNAFYFRREITLGDAYRAALRRWLPLVGVNLLYFGAGLILYVGAALLIFALVFALFLVTASLHAVGVAIAVVVGIAVGLVALAFFIVAILAVQVSYFTCVIEGENAIVAFARGIMRVFTRVGLARSLLVGIAYGAIALGIWIVSFAGQSLIVGLLHNAVAGTAYSTIVRVATAAFTTAFVAIFYYDLRVREEGLDLTLAADAVRDAALVPERA